MRIPNLQLESRPRTVVRCVLNMCLPIIILLIPGFGLGTTVCAQTAKPNTVSINTDDGRRVPSPLEQKVKAAYLYNFSRYFDWPTDAFDDAQGHFVIGVLGKDPLGRQLDKLAQKKKIKNRKIVIQRFDSIEQLQSCHLLFITSSVTNDEFQAAIDKTKQASILVVSEHPWTKAKGSSIHLFVDQADTVGFAIDIDVVNSQKLQVSAKLLKLARVSETSAK